MNPYSKYELRIIPFMMTICICILVFGPDYGVRLPQTVQSQKVTYIALPRVLAHLEKLSLVAKLPLFLRLY